MTTPLTWIAGLSRLAVTQVLSYSMYSTGYRLQGEKGESKKSKVGELR